MFGDDHLQVTGPNKTKGNWSNSYKTILVFIIQNEIVPNQTK